MVIPESSGEHRVGKGREEMIFHARNLVLCDLIKCWTFLVIETFAIIGNTQNTHTTHV